MFISKTEFSLHIEDIVRQLECSYVDALMYYANTTGAHDEDIAKMISDPLKEKIRVEVANDFILPKRTDGELEF